MLFIYGTLQDPDILAAALGRQVEAQALQPASAPNYRAVVFPGRVYPALVAATGATAPGHVLHALNEADMAALDGFEGEEYRRQTITVLVAGQPAAAQTYLPVAAVDPAGPAWSLSDWTARHKAEVLAGETATAQAVRDRLTRARGSRFRAG